MNCRRGHYALTIIMLSNARNSDLRRDFEEGFENWPAKPTACACECKGSLMSPPPDLSIAWVRTGNRGKKEREG